MRVLESLEKFSGLLGGFGCLFAVAEVVEGLGGGADLVVVEWLDVGAVGTTAYDSEYALVFLEKTQ